MWESTVRLVGDDEAAHRALTQLKKAIRSRVTETELPEGSQLQLVSLTTSTVTAQPSRLAPHHCWGGFGPRAQGSRERGGASPTCTYGPYTQYRALWSPVGLWMTKTKKSGRSEKVASIGQAQQQLAACPAVQVAVEAIACA